ncbi:MAG TPA: hypothetical protein VGP72_11985 [Planctomycetota bacterium]|jgi:FtsH-binding integral membrane protein/phage FluMu protein Com
MAIHFACSQCNKKLFAQDQYAGLLVTCPTCHARNVIPTPPSPPAPPPVGRPVPGDPDLIDMEKGPPAMTDAQTKTEGGGEKKSDGETGGRVDGGTASTEASSEEQAVTPPSEIRNPPPEDATRRCPICAETIKVAAKKCRFCNTIFDEDLRRQEAQEQQRQNALSEIAEAERSAHTWRVIATLVSGLTIGWLVLLTLQVWAPLTNSSLASSPWPLMIFDPLLVIGMLWASRQMRRGPAQVFVTAAMTILLCMPLNILLGLPVSDAQLEEELVRQNARLAQLSPQERENLIRVLMLMLYTFIGAVLSVPVWVAALKVAGVARRRAASRTEA